jgi:hypothetical protein
MQGLPHGPIRLLKRYLADDRRFDGLGGDENDDVADLLDLFRLEGFVTDSNRPRVVMLTTGRRSRAEGSFNTGYSA